MPPGNETRQEFRQHALCVALCVVRRALRLAFCAESLDDLRYGACAS